MHHDGALDLDREDGQLHTRANPDLVRRLVRHVAGGAAADPALRTDRGADKRRAMQRVTEQGEMDRRRQRARAAWQGSVLSAKKIAAAKGVFTALMSTRKERSPSRWLGQAEMMLDQLESDRKRPRVLILPFAHAAGHNFQYVSSHVILFAPLYEGEDAVAATAKEQQAMGRVFRPGQRSPVQVYRIVLQGPKGEATLDREMIARNRDEKTIQAATSANV